MRLKEYQQEVIDKVEAFLAAVADEHAGGNGRHASLDAWRRVIGGAYHERRNGLGEDMPNFVVKVPTGGGKTVIATQLLGSVYRTLLEDRRGAGLVLWVVPSNQIYRDTIRRLSDRDDWYRLMLEHAVSRRIEVWEKTDIARLTPAKLRECLNILVVQLASTNRKDKETLKFFSDSGGNIVQHFPPEDDAEGHRALKERVANLEMLEDDARTGRHLVKTSIGNLVRLCRPVVVIDEGHRATSQQARETIEGFNASAVIELSATPKGKRNREFIYEPNIIVRVSGEQLLREEMIKLPLNIATSALADWKDVLTKARDKREALAKAADELAAARDVRHRIRPIVLVQVERTGRDQRDTKHIHSEAVREYLHGRLGIAANAVAVKTAEMDELSDIDNLMDPDCPIEWIITKSALQEGWDCPFAYILVSLDNTGSETAMTQLIGRILRQPHQMRTPRSELNESYVYCLRLTAGVIAKQVKKALEQEGYEGDTSGLIQAEGGDVRQVTTRTARIRAELADLYTRPFEGKIYLPRFCVKSGRGYEPLDWYQHLLSEVDVGSFEYASIDWKLEEDIAKAKDRFYRMTLGDDAPSSEYETEADLLESDELVMSWIVASLGYDYLSFKQLKMIVRGVYERLLSTELSLRDRLGLVKFVVRDHISRFIDEQIDKQCERAFSELFEAGRLQFYLECTECRFEIPDGVEVRATKHLVREDNSPILNSLFDYVDDTEFNEFERAVALYLDEHPEVLWWYRNLIGEEHFTIQGYRRERIRPDFVTQSRPEGRVLNQVLVVETKGDQLAGNLDTAYKRKMAGYFRKAGKRVAWQRLGEDFKDHQFRFQVIQQTGPTGRDWKDELREQLEVEAGA